MTKRHQKYCSITFNRQILYKILLTIESTRLLFTPSITLHCNVEQDLKFKCKKIAKVYGIISSCGPVSHFKNYNLGINNVPHLFIILHSITYSSGINTKFFEFFRLYNRDDICLRRLLCIRIVATLEPNQLHISNESYHKCSAQK